MTATRSRARAAGTRPGSSTASCAQRIRYRLRAANAKATWLVDDPYAYGPVLGPLDDWLIGEGAHAELYNRLGAHAMEHEGTPACISRCGRRGAQRVSVVGDFNAWDGRRHVMRKRIGTGVWEIFVPGCGEGTLYKYEIIGADGALLAAQGRSGRIRRGAAAVDRLGRPRRPRVSRGPTATGWRRARARDPRRAPMSIYEVHLGSWRRGDGNRWLDLRRARRTRWSPTPSTWASRISS